MNNRLQSTISLCRRAGKLLLGFDQVKEAVEAGQVKAVFVSTDLSDKSKKEVSFFCSKHNVPAARLPLSKDEIKEAKDYFDDYDIKFSADKVYKVSLNLTIKGSKETKDYYTSLLVLKENGDWKLYNGGY